MEPNNWPSFIMDLLQTIALPIMIIWGAINDKRRDEKLQKSINNVQINLRLKPPFALRCGTIIRVENGKPFRMFCKDYPQQCKHIKIVKNNV